MSSQKERRWRRFCGNNSFRHKALQRLEGLSWHAQSGLGAFVLFQLLANKALHRTPSHCALGAGERRR
jgi:hypothetical protein